MKLQGAVTFKIPRLSRREVILAAILALSCITAIYYRFVFEPQWNTIKELQADLIKQQQVLNERLSQGWNDIPALGAQSAEIKSSIENIYKIVPRIKNEPALLVDFYELTRLHNLGAEAIKFGELKEVEGKGYSTFTVTLGVTGQNDNIYSFLANMEKYPRLNRVAEIKFIPESAVASTCILSYEFYVMHSIQPDPLVYPFIEGKYGKDQPYNIFDIYFEEENADNSKPGTNQPAGGLPPAAKAPTVSSPAANPPAVESRQVSKAAEKSPGQPAAGNKVAAAGSGQVKGGIVPQGTPSGAAKPADGETRKTTYVHNDSDKSGFIIPHEFHMFGNAIYK